MWFIADAAAAAAAAGRVSPSDSFSLSTSFYPRPLAISLTIDFALARPRRLVNYASATWNIFRLLRSEDVILLCGSQSHLSGEIVALWKCEN